jgi:hypothetical protein
LLLDPRWQRRRLQVLDRAGFACECCGDTSSTLHVHHRIYRKGAAPWEYADEELRALCENCHEAEHQMRRSIDEALARLDPELFDDVLGYIEGLATLRAALRVDSPNALINVRSAEHAMGLGASIGLTSYEAARSLARDGLTHNDLLRWYRLARERGTAHDLVDGAGARQ